jgi:hypothetical protein
LIDHGYQYDCVFDWSQKNSAPDDKDQDLGDKSKLGSKEILTSKAHQMIQEKLNCLIGQDPYVDEDVNTSDLSSF